MVIYKAILILFFLTFSWGNDKTFLFAPKDINPRCLSVADFDLINEKLYEIQDGDKFLIANVINNAFQCHISISKVQAEIDTILLADKIAKLEKRVLELENNNANVKDISYYGKFTEGALTVSLAVSISLSVYLVIHITIVMKVKTRQDQEQGQKQIVINQPESGIKS